MYKEIKREKYNYKLNVFKFVNLIYLNKIKSSQNNLVKSPSSRHYKHHKFKNVNHLTE